ncbi:HVO_2922 family protein [Salinirubellus sp. GCM10025818]|uniref:HVO_2922 family protein n=1 Tax=Salinirubellus TaxID=2162630 RepID=UPI0030CD896E
MSRKATFEVFRDNADEWRWRLVASNGNIIADSGEGYQSKQGVERGIESVKRSAPDAEVQFREGT